MARFEELEETHAEVKTEADTVGAQKEWSSGYDKWMTVSGDRESTEACT